MAEQCRSDKLSEKFCVELCREDHPFIFISLEDILILYDDPYQARKILEKFLADSHYDSQKLLGYVDSTIKYSYKTKEAFHRSSRSVPDLKYACLSAMYSKGLEKGIEIIQQYRQERFGSRLVLSI